MSFSPGSMRETNEVLIPDEVLNAVFGRIDAAALGIAIGLVSGTLLFLATTILLLRGGETVGPHLSLLGQYIPGYSVTWPGSVVGFVSGLGIGFVLGWGIAILRNTAIAVYVYVSVLFGRLDRYMDDIS